MNPISWALRHNWCKSPKNWCLFVVVYGVFGIKFFPENKPTNQPLTELSHPSKINIFFLALFHIVLNQTNFRSQKTSTNKKKYEIEIEMKIALGMKRKWKWNIQNLIIEQTKGCLKIKNEENCFQQL